MAKERTTDVTEAIKLSGVSVQRNEHEILSNVSLTLQYGDIVYLTGTVGTGKSSLLETIYAELPLTNGIGFVLGYDLRKIGVRKRQEMRRQMGIVFQSSGQLLYDRSVYANLDFVLRVTTKLPKHERKNRIEQSLDAVGMKGKGYKYPHELSGGEAARVCIARSLIITPKLIVMDEPTAGLDNETALTIGQLVHGIAKSGVAVLMSTHNKYLIKHLPATTYKIFPEKKSLELISSPKESI
ncbi:MAG: ATP-binding cassette domain-containing protein [Porphyromonas sp.]|nr:ATP-binding cassette domain-containing protein [Porphyromonas sp.]